MAKLYRAAEGFSSPADPESLKKNKAARKLEEGEKKAALLAEVKWMNVKKGDKVIPYNDEILKSWLENDLLEEVKASDG